MLIRTEWFLAVAIPTEMRNQPDVSFRTAEGQLLFRATDARVDALLLKGGVKAPQLRST